MDPTLKWIDQKFGARPVVAEANTRALKAGYAYGETTEMFHTHYRVPKAQARRPGLYRNITGNEATGARLPDRLASWPSGRCSTAATRSRRPRDILHQLSGYKHFGVRTFQAEDEIAAIGAAIGASLRRRARRHRHVRARASRSRRRRSASRSWSSCRSSSSTSSAPARRPACRPRPSRRDLLQVLFGRNGESPGRRSSRRRRPASASTCAIEACAHRAQVHDPGHLPVRRVPRQRRRAVADPRRSTTCPTISVAERRQGRRRPFLPYERDPETLARPWAIPGTPGLEHRIGGLEKADVTGNVSYDPDNHHRMTLLRAQKVAGIADDIPPLEVFGPEEGDLLVLGWGSTYGAIRTRRRAAAGPGPVGRPRPPALPQPVPGQHRRRPAALPAGAHPGDQPRPARRCCSGRRSWSTPSGYNRVRASRSAIAEIVDEAERILDGASRHDDDRRSRQPRAQPAPSPDASSSPARTSSPTRRSAGAPAAATTRSSPRPRRSCPTSACRRRTSCSSRASAAPAACRTT